MNSNSASILHLLQSKLCSGILPITIIAWIGILLAITGFLVDVPWLGMIFPAIVIGTFMVLFKMETLYRGMFFLIPLSLAIELPGGLSTDFPAEVFLWAFWVVSILLLIKNGMPNKMANSLTFLISAHLIWTIISSLYAHDPLVAFKYSLAKSWYILPFYFLPFFIIQKEQELRVIFKYFIVGLILASFYFFIQHLQEGLSFLSRTNAGLPIWRNHVNYACTLVISLPILVYLFKTSNSPDRKIYWLIFILFLVFIYFSFARIAYVCILAAIVYSIILKLRLTDLALVATSISLFALIIYYTSNNRFVHLAPEYEKAIMQLDFERKLAATAKGEDVSTMERLHRWVAAKRMIEERPVVGFGPGNFYSSYKEHTLFSFETYVSDNPDKSGVHNHFLMIFAEQGLPGLFIWLSLLLVALRSIQFKYDNFENKTFYWLLGTLLTMILVINLVNDMIEVVKIGSIFFFVLTLIHVFPQKRSQKIS